MEIEMRFRLNVTPSTLSVLALADQLAKLRGHPQISSEHLALALTASDGCLGATALSGLGVTIETLQPEIEKLVDEQ